MTGAAARSSAVILGAGLGSRLQPLTDDRPKCAVTLGGEPLAARLLRQLHRRGLERATVVVGHMAERGRHLITTSLTGLDLELSFVDNPAYAATNTMYSALLAMSALADGGYLIEGDIAASDAAVDRLAAAPIGASWWAAVPWTADHAGSRLSADDDGRIRGQSIAPRGTVAAGQWKSAGMLALDAAGAHTLGRALALDAAAGHCHLYYDQVIARHPGEIDLHILDLGRAAWVEIDDHDDLALARRLFEAREALR